MYGEVAEVLAAGLVDDQPHLAEFPEAVAAWATAEAQAILMRRHVDEVGALEEGRPREASLAWLVRLERMAEQRRKVLGLDPMAEAQLIRDRAAAHALAASAAVDLEALAERGRRIVQARRAAGLEVPDLAGEAVAAVVASTPEGARPRHVERNGDREPDRRADAS